MADRILPLQMDEKGAAAYQGVFEKVGCIFKLAKKTSHTISDDQGNIAYIVLDDGEALPCDMVIIGAGVRPAVEFLNPADVEIDRSSSHLVTAEWILGNGLKSTTG